MSPWPTERLLTTPGAPPPTRHPGFINNEAGIEWHRCEAPMPGCGFESPEKSPRGHCDRLQGELGPSITITGEHLSVVRTLGTVGTSPKQCQTSIYALIPCLSKLALALPGHRIRHASRTGAASWTTDDSSPTRCLRTIPPVVRPARREETVHDLFRSESSTSTIS